MATAIKCKRCMKWFYLLNNLVMPEPYDNQLCNDCNLLIKNQKSSAWKKTSRRVLDIIRK